jgi:hypothetical protein
MNYPEIIFQMGVIPNLMRRKKNKKQSPVGDWFNLLVHE